MANKVYANMMEVSCKAASGKTIAAFPDVCFTPPQTPATPPGLPIPYPNTGMAADSTDGSSSVKISGKEVMLKNKSCFSKSSGDEAGSAPKKGVVTSKNTGKVYFNMWSMDVKVEGENVVRHLDITTHNHGSTPGNSPPMPHTDGQSGPGVPETCDQCAAEAACTGSPVNPILGAKVLVGDEDLDFTLEGPLPLVWQRAYLSSQQRVGWFGRGWTSPLEVSLFAVAGADSQRVEGIDYVGPLGRRVRFDALRAGERAYSRQEKVWLERAPSGQYRVVTGEGITYWFDDRRQGAYLLVAITDRNDNAIHLEYVAGPAQRRSIQVHCSGAQVVELTFRDERLVDIALLQTEESDREEPLMHYEFSAAGDLAAVFNRAGECLRRFDYTAQRLMSRQVHAEAFEAFYEYSQDDDAKVVRHWDNVGGDWRFEYLAHQTVVTDQDGRTERYHFDKNRRWIGYTDPEGGLTARGVDRDGNVTAIVDPEQNVTSTAFDERGNPARLRDAAGAVTEVEWHPEFDLPTAITDALGHTTTYRYDERGNLVLEVDATGAETKYAYDSRGLLVALTDANGGTTRFERNARGQLTRHIDCSGHATTLKYNRWGQVLEVADALDEKTTFEYDGAGRMIRQTLADGVSEAYESDIAGHLLAIVDNHGSRTEYRYAPDGLPIARVDALGHVLAYRFDRGRRLRELVNENGAVHTFAYDRLNRLVEEKRFDGGLARYAYSHAGSLVQMVEAPGSAQAITTRFKRDPLGRLLERVSEHGRMLCEYDAAGQLIRARAEHSGVELNLAYDALGRVVREQTTAGQHQATLRHEYDPLGNRLRTTLPDGSSLGTLYYGSGHAHQITLDSNPICDMERDALHREVLRTQGRRVMRRLYAPGGNLRQQTSLVGLPARLDDPRTAAVPIDRTFTYDRAGRLAASVDRMRPWSYEFDAVERLTRFNDERFSFDPASNLVARGQAPGAAPPVQDNRVAVHEDKRYRYDEHGRIVEKRIGAHKVMRFAWDDEHHLVEAVAEERGTATTTRYLYDPRGRRIAKVTAQGVTRFVWDEDRLLQEIDGSSQRTYVYEPGSTMPLAQAVRTGDAAAATASQIYYFHCDQIGLPRELTNAEGDIVWEGEYRPWGGLRTERAEVVPGGAHQPLRFQGQYFDAETGWHYNVNRYYDPDIARFTTADPMGLEGGFNLYSYPTNPLQWYDPLGLVAHPANCKNTTLPSHRYVIVEIATGKLYKTGISSKPLTGKGTSGRATNQVNKLNAKARAASGNPNGPDKYKAVVVEKDISRCAATKGEQEVVDKGWERRNQRYLGMKRPIPTALKK